MRTALSGEQVTHTCPLWTVLRSREQFNRPELQLLTVVSEHGVAIRDLTDGRAPSEDLSPYRVVHRGDLVVNKLWARFGAYGVSDFDGIISPAYWVLKVDHERFFPRFLHYLLRSAPYRAEVWKRSKDQPPNGFDLPWEQFRSIPIPLLSLSRQRFITDYLDAEATRIDSLVTAKRQLLHILDSHWSADIASRLCPPWSIRRVLDGEPVREPEGWRLRKLGSLTKRKVPITYGILLPGPKLDEGIPYIGAGDVRQDRLKLAELPRTAPEISAAYPRTKMRAGELVYAIRGSFGAVEQIPEELDGVNLSRDAARIAPGTEVEPRWLMYALKSELCQEQFRRKEVGATITGVNIEDLKSVRLAVPNLRSQLEDVRYLDARSVVYQRLQRTLDTQIGLLTEHKEALIAAAISGELDTTEVVS